MSTDFLPLRTILKHGRSPEHPVAIMPDGTRTWADLTGDIDALVRELGERDGQRWILHSSSSYQFLAGLLAVVATESTAILPPKPKEGILKSCAETADGALTDASLEEIPGVAADHHLFLQEHTGGTDAPEQIEFPYLDAERPCIEFFTSGTTGERSTIQKSLAHLEQDTDAEERIWGEQIDDTAFFGTVSQQHIYGILFRLLWPLCSGKPFHSEMLMYPDDFKEAVETSSRDVVLVTSPSHLKSFVRSGVPGELKDHIRMVVSGGGSVPKEIAEEVHDQLGFYPHDVFGTTETGGIGWRTADEETWHTFNNVETDIDNDGRLLVRSPAVSTSDDWYPTGDLAEQQNGSFVLRGREDRVVKIADTRISLPEMEELLENDDRVEQAVAVSLEPEDPATERTTVGMFIKPEEDLSDTDTLERDLRDLLTEHFPSVALPKFWRFLEEVPEDQLGKPQYDELRSQLDRT